jgi:protocatechuate 4,5-dioxygenase beta chain
MATVAAVIASTHHPFYYRASTATGEDRPPFADEWVAKIEAFRETLTSARSDVLVMVGSDHFHQLWLDNMPQFLIGKAPFYDANFYNEEREFGLPRMFLHGREDLSAYLLREGMDAGFDLAFSNELRIDHSITCPLITLRPQADLPIVPIYTNIFAPPLRSRSDSSSSARRSGSWSRRGHPTSGWRSSAPGTCRLSWAVPASSGRTALTRPSTAGQWNGSRQAT